jgi:hypothetical protein
MGVLEAPNFIQIIGSVVYNMKYNSLERKILKIYNYREIVLNMS